MKIRQSKEALQAVDDHIGENAIINSEELTDFVVGVISLPDSETLTRNYCRKFAQNRIRRRRDSDGLRSHFSTGDRSNPEYVNLNKVTLKDLPSVKQAEEYQSKLAKQLGKNIEKISHTAKILEGQITLAELVDINTARRIAK